MEKEEIGRNKNYTKKYFLEVIEKFMSLLIPDDETEEDNFIMQQTELLMLNISHIFKDEISKFFVPFIHQNFVCDEITNKIGAISAFSKVIGKISESENLIKLYLDQIFHFCKYDNILLVRYCDHALSEIFLAFPQLIFDNSEKIIYFFDHTFSDHYTIFLSGQVLGVVCDVLKKREEFSNFLSSRFEGYIDILMKQLEQ